MVFQQYLICFKCFRLNEGINMKTEYITNKWLRVLDLGGMVIAPISISIPLFLWAVQSYQTASSNGTNYNYSIALFLGALVGLIGFGFYFGWAFKSYIYHQATRDDIIPFRIMYSGLILGSLFVIFVFFF